MSLIRQKRRERNIVDSHSDKEFNMNCMGYCEKFGTKRKHERPIHKGEITKPSQLLMYLGNSNVPKLLDPFYTVDQLQTVNKFAAREKITKDDFKNQIVYTPQIALYMIFMSEDDIFEKYMNCWKKFYNVPLKIPEEMITEDLNPGCGCSGCFGTCVRVANRYGILPDRINHEHMSRERADE